MEAASLRLGSRISSVVCCGLAILGAVSGAYTWMRLGNASDLLFALAGIAIAPVWFVRPLRFSVPIREALKPRPDPPPQWAFTLTIVFLTLLGASLVVRWTA